MTHFSPFSKSPIESQAYLVLANELSEVGWSTSVFVAVLSRKTLSFRFAFCLNTTRTTIS